MIMAVHHRLPGSLPEIEPDIVDGWRQIFLNHFFALIDRCKHSMFHLNRQGKIISHMPERDHQEVPLADRVPVPPGIAENILRHHLISGGIAERAGHWSFVHDAYPSTSVMCLHFFSRLSNACSCQRAGL